ncbi:MAG: ATP-binding protein [Gemmatimonadota bacterium]
MIVLPTAVSADVPATAEFVQILRNVAAGFAARLDMPIDQIEEVRLAVTEGATLLLDEAGATTLRMSIGREGDALVTVISCDGRASAWPTDRALASWPWLVVKGLTDEVDLDRDGDGALAIAFTKRRERVAR